MVSGGTGAAADAAWKVIHACAGGDGLLRAAAGSSLYPHVWTRDVGMAAFGILACARNDADRVLVTKSLLCIASCQTPLGRAPLKVDVTTGTETLENSAGVDASLWLTVAVDAVVRSGGKADAALVASAIAALRYAQHLDVNGDGLLETPEASDWADMMPHRHNVLFVNVLYVAALEAGARLATGADAKAFAAAAADLRDRVPRAFSVTGSTDAAGAAVRLAVLAQDNPEFGITGQYATKYGDLPFLLPYVAFRAVGTHCDTVGNLLAVLTGVADQVQSARLLDYLDAVGAASPQPTMTMYPPLTPGAPDWRDHFHWRNLNLPHHYQNGGAWPFCGALHVAALVHAGRMDAARVLLAKLEAVCMSPAAPFPEWTHGQTGVSMGEVNQLWSAAGLLFAQKCVADGRAPFFGAGA